MENYKQHKTKYKIQCNHLPFLIIAIFEMNNAFHNLANNVLPFQTCSPFLLSQLHQSSKNLLTEKLQNNNFSSSMLDHVNDISKDNYTCKYYDQSNIDRLVKSHHNSALKVIHLNCSSIVKNGLDLIGYLAHLRVNFDIVMLTETRQTTIAS